MIEHFGGQAHQTFAGVFDGHGPYGRNAAKYASTRLPQLVAARLGAAGSDRKRLKALRCGAEAAHVCQLRDSRCRLAHGCITTCTGEIWC